MLSLGGNRAVTELTAEVSRAGRSAEREAGSKRRSGVLVADAPPEADELAANIKILPGWACAAIVLGLASALWILIILAIRALF